MPLRRASLSCSELQNTCPTGFNQFAAGVPTPTISSVSNPTGGFSGAVDPNFRSTSVAQYNLFVQQSFSGNVLSIGYVGIAGRHVLVEFPDINVPPPNTCGGVGTACYTSLRPYVSQLPNVTTITQYASKGTSEYNSLQTSIDRRPSKGLTVGATYTWAHDLDDTSPVGGIPQGYGYSPSTFRTSDRGNAGFDTRHRFTARINYALPFGAKFNGVKGALAHGWQANTLYVWSTGVPFSVINSSSVSDTYTAGQDRPNQLGNNLGVPNPSVKQYFNNCYLDSSNVAHNCAGSLQPVWQVQHIGTLGEPLTYAAATVNPTIGPLYERRDQLYGPHYRHLDVSLFKTFAVTAKANLEFRVEGFNVTNTTNFAQPNNTLANANFGQITATSQAYNPRQVQFALKLNY